MGTLSDTQALQDRLLTVAKEEFAKQGLKGARLQKIADDAQVPKATLLYHFKSKTVLYQRVLETILSAWDEGFEELTIDAEPEIFFRRLIDTKIASVCADPLASKLFAQEIIQGAPHLDAHLSQKVKPWFRQQVSILEQWMDKGKIRRTDPTRLIFLIWAATQHYADFQAQVLTLMNRQEFDAELATDTSTFLHEFICNSLGIMDPKHR